MVCFSSHSVCAHLDFRYISVLVELTKVEGTQHGQLIAAQIQDVTVRVQSVRHFSVSQMALLIENAHLLLSGNINQRNNICEVLLAAAWICGEYSEYVQHKNFYITLRAGTNLTKKFFEFTNH
jgi:hypothetical protein